MQLPKAKTPHELESLRRAIAAIRDAPLPKLMNREVPVAEFE